jgi:hypothetical protein
MKSKPRRVGGGLLYCLPIQVAQYTLYSAFFLMRTKVFVHLTHLMLPQISETYLKIHVLSEHLIKIHPE